MDQVLAEQPPDTWDSFPLFQILNDYLRTDGWFKIISDALLVIFSFDRLKSIKNNFVAPTKKINNLIELILIPNHRFYRYLILIIYFKTGVL